jgi:hypothetical protein
MIGVVYTQKSVYATKVREVIICSVITDSDARSKIIMGLRKKLGLMSILFQYKAYQHNLQTLGKCHQNTIQSGSYYGMTIQSNWDSIGQEGISLLLWDAEMTLSKASAIFSSALDRCIVRMGPQNTELQRLMSVKWVFEYMNTIVICCCPCICLVATPLILCGYQEDCIADWVGFEPLSKTKTTTGEMFREMALSTFVSIQEFENFVGEQTLGLGISSPDIQALHR